MSGFLERNDPSLLLVPDWDDFVQWARDGGYGEEYLDINDSRCEAVQLDYLEEVRSSTAAAC